MLVYNIQAMYTYGLVLSLGFVYKNEFRCIYMRNDIIFLEIIIYLKYLEEGYGGTVVLERNFFCYAEFSFSVHCQVWF